MNKYQWGLICLLWALVAPASAYYSNYDKIQWDPRGAAGLFYCLDITDENFVVYEGLQNVVCGTDLYEFSPREFVQTVLNTDLPDGFEFYWRVWSENGYGGDGFEGKVTVGEPCGLYYRSDAEHLQWGCRFQDHYYCVDLYNSERQGIQTPAVCGDDLHSYNPTPLLVNLNAPSGWYYWKVWSEHAYNYADTQSYLEGSFFYEPPASPAAPNSHTILQHLLGTWQISYVENNQVQDLLYHLDEIVEDADDEGYILLGRDEAGNRDVLLRYDFQRQSYLLIDADSTFNRYLRFSQNPRTALWSGYTYIIDTDDHHGGEYSETSAIEPQLFPIQGRRLIDIFGQS